MSDLHAYEITDMWLTAIAGITRKNTIADWKYTIGFAIYYTERDFARGMWGVS